MRPIVLIPARMASTRLPDKPLADIGGIPMILHVWQRAKEADIGTVVVATDDDRIAAAVRDARGEAVMTRSDHSSGSDRIWEALQTEDSKGTYDTVVNLQGDLPTLEPHLLRAVLEPLQQSSQTDIATLAAAIHAPDERHSPHVVKPVIALPRGGRIGRALYFSRATVPHGEGPLYHHIGIYAYRRAALETFVSLPPSPLEQREKLEQLRALALGMHIALAVVDSVPLGVDTEDDLRTARRLMAGQDQDR